MRFLTVTFTRNPQNDFAVFAKGYLRAASKLAEDLLSSKRFSDYDAYPVVFLYRQSLELYLKNVIYKSALLSALKRMNEINPNLYNTHNLTFLSKEAAEILQKLFPDDDGIKHFTERMVRISSEFSDIDPGSYAYRYPINKQGSPSTESHQVVNLQALHHTMKEFLKELETVDFGLDVETSQAEEIYKIQEDFVDWVESQTQETEPCLTKRCD